MGKYYCPCGTVLDTDKYIGEKDGFMKAISELIDHFDCLEKYDKNPKYVAE